jgi:hypothetical protein
MWLKNPIKVSTLNKMWRRNYSNFKDSLHFDVEIMKILRVYVLHFCGCLKRFSCHYISSHIILYHSNFQNSHKFFLLNPPLRGYLMCIIILLLSILLHFMNHVRISFAFLFFFFQPSQGYFVVLLILMTCVCYCHNHRLFLGLK